MAIQNSFQVFWIYLDERLLGLDSNISCMQDYDKNRCSKHIFAIFYLKLGAC